MNDYRYEVRLLKEVKPNKFVSISVVFSNTYSDLSEIEKKLQPPKRRICRYQLTILGSNQYEFKMYNPTCKPFKPTIPLKYLYPSKGA